jgi:hypothetical protein
MEMKYQTHHLPGMTREEIGEVVNELIADVFISADQQTLKGRTPSGGFYSPTVDAITMLAKRGALALELRQHEGPPKTMAERMAAQAKVVGYARP